MSRRTQRIAALMRQIMGDLLLRKISDPRVDRARTSVTRVDVAEDLLTAKVFVSVMGTPGEQARTIEALRHAAGHVQELMTKQMSLRTTPVLSFLLDTDFKKTLETLDIIERVSDEIRQKDAERAAAESEAGPSAAEVAGPQADSSDSRDEP